MDFLLAGTRVIVQQSLPLPPVHIPLQAARDCGEGRKLLPSDRNAIPNRNGMVFGFRPEARSPSAGFHRMPRRNPKRLPKPVPLEFGQIALRSKNRTTTDAARAGKRLLSLLTKPE
jgi:hypothetical protein